MNRYKNIIIECLLGLKNANLISQSDVKELTQSISKRIEIHGTIDIAPTSIVDNNVKVIKTNFHDVVNED